MSTPARPSSKIGNRVVFKPPVSVGELPTRSGTIRDEIWTEVCHDRYWGYYVYTSQLIEWDEGGHSIRLTYYYQAEGASRWLFGGQYSIEDSPDVIRTLLERTLEKMEWYGR